MIAVDLLDDRDVVDALERGDLRPYPSTPTPIDEFGVEQLRARIAPRGPSERVSAADRNNVTLVGHLGADPELVTVSGRQILKVRFCTEANGRLEWHRVTVRGRDAEPLSRSLRNGDRARIDGHLQTSSYEKNGETRYSTEIVATRVLPSGGAA